MARDRRVGGVGQTDLGQADSTPPQGQVGRGAAGQEAIEQRLIEQLAGQLGLDRAADDLRAAAQNVTGAAAFFGFGEERFLGVAAGVTQGHALGRVEAVHPLGQRGGDRVGQRQVHVVAAEQDVLAHGQAGKDQVAPLIGHRDQGEVGGAAAHVADQNDIADFELASATSRPGWRARHRRPPAAPRARSPA